MTTQNEVIGDPKYIPVLDKGFVGLVDYMGTDSSVVQAARVSYGEGTKSVSTDRGLIRYLMRHRHTSPFEMITVKLHIRLPIFVMRQLVRHRTSSLNEYSGRYSIMSDEFYVPDASVIMPQSKDNKQGRSGQLSEEDLKLAQDIITSGNTEAYNRYKLLLGDAADTFDPEDDINCELAGFSSEFPGVARELARMVLPVNNYTELYWAQNVHNLLHLLKLRLDPHAQYEIRAVAQAIYEIIQPLYPMVVEAWEDYVQNAKTITAPEMVVLKAMLGNRPITDIIDGITVSDPEFFDKAKITKRELDEFINKFS